MERGVYFDAWFPRQHCYHPSLPPRRLRMVDDLVDYRATVARLGGARRRVDLAALPRAGGVRRRSTPRSRFYGFVNDSEFIAECHKHGIKVFGIVFEAQGWEFPVELDDDEDDGAGAQRAARRRARAAGSGCASSPRTATRSCGSRSSTTSPTACVNSDGEPVTDLHRGVLLARHPPGSRATPAGSSAPTASTSATTWTATTRSGASTSRRSSGSRSTPASTASSSTRPSCRSARSSTAPASAGTA